ncbi:DUF1801 domain-containing protein [Pseudoxanthomonas suwonensis]|nr:DUF1801 domain-containing protein [Pseudoxanthomonas suwonensis]
MTPEEQLDGFIARFTPEIAGLARAALVKMRMRLLSAIQLVYDNYNALAVGFGPTQRASEAIFSLAVYPKRVNLCFLQGGRSSLKDPHGLLQGSGSTNRFVPLASAAALDKAEIDDLIAQALIAARIPLPPAGAGGLVIKSVSARQRPRRP